MIIVEDASKITLNMLKFIYEHNAGVLSIVKGKQFIAYKSCGTNE